MKKYLSLLMILVVSLAACSSSEDAENILATMDSDIFEKETAYTYVSTYELSDDDSEIDTFKFNPENDEFIVELDYIDSSNEHTIVNYTVDSSNTYSDIVVTDESGEDVSDIYNYTEADVMSYDVIVSDSINAEIEDATDSFSVNYEDKEFSETDEDFVLTLPADDDYIYTYKVSKDGSSYAFSAEGEYPFEITIEFEK